MITVDAKGDAATQVSQIQDLIAQNIDALIYIPAGATAAAVPVKAARAAGIPVVNIDRNAEERPATPSSPLTASSRPGRYATGSPRKRAEKARC